MTAQDDAVAAAAAGEPFPGQRLTDLNGTLVSDPGLRADYEALHALCRLLRSVDYPPDPGRRSRLLSYIELASRRRRRAVAASALVLAAVVLIGVGLWGNGGTEAAKGTEAFPPSHETNPTRPGIFDAMKKPLRMRVTRTDELRATIGDDGATQAPLLFGGSSTGGRWMLAPLARRAGFTLVVPGRLPEHMRLYAARIYREASREFPADIVVVLEYLSLQDSVVLVQARREALADLQRVSKVCPSAWRCVTSVRQGTAVLVLSPSLTDDALQSVAQSLRPGG